MPFKKFQEIEIEICFHNKIEFFHNKIEIEFFHNKIEIET